MIDNLGRGMTAAEAAQMLGLPKHQLVRKHGERFRQSPHAPNLLHLPPDHHARLTKKGESKGESNAVNYTRRNFIEMKIVIDTDTLTKDNIDATIEMLSALRSSIKRNIDSMPIEEFCDAVSLTVRANNVIRSNGIKTVADIKRALKNDPRKLGGPKTQADIKFALSELGEKTV